MNNDALVAALGTDAVDAVHGYRLRVIAEATRHGLRLVSEPLDGFERAGGDASGEANTVDPIDIRLRFQHSPGRGDLAGRLLHWDPASGWSLSHVTASAALCYYAGPGATPLRLVPDPREVVEWATGELHGPAARPQGVELDDDPAAIHRLLSFLDPELRLHVGASTSQKAGRGAAATSRPRTAPPARPRPNTSPGNRAWAIRHEQRTG